MPDVGDRLGRYLLTAVLGRGGMGTVFAARDEALERDVAVKVINPAMAEDEEYRERFRREAVAMSRMDSPHVVAVHDHGEHESALFIVTQLVTGGDLERLIRDAGPLPPRQAVDLAVQVLSGLADAHAAGIAHRDIKPSNVLLTADRARALLCDFGIATVPGADLTRTGALVGSFPYMAPERHTGDHAHRGSPAGDIYAVGCLLWQMLSGSAPYAGTDVEIAMGHLHGPIPQLPGADPFSSDINRVLQQSLAKDPKGRYPSARAMRADLTAVLAGAPAAVALPEQTSVRQPVVLPDTVAPPKRRRLRASLLTMAGVAALVVAVVVTASVTASRIGVPVVGLGASGDDASGSATGAEDLQPGSVLEREGRSRAEAGRPDAGRTGAGDPAGAGGNRAGDNGDNGNDSDGAGPQQGDSAPKQSAPPSTSGPDPEPQPRYRCWNGTKVMRYRSCSYPQGRAGADWLYSGLDALRCTRFDDPNTSADVEGFVCAYGANGRHKIRVLRWTSAAAARARYDWMDKRAVWTCGSHGERCGVKFFHSGSSGYYWSRIYDGRNHSWSVTIHAKSVDDRKLGGRLVGACRDSERMRGAPI